MKLLPMPRWASLAAAGALAFSARAAESVVHLTTDGPATFLQVEGDPAQEWRFQTSSDLSTWADALELGATFSGLTNAALTASGSSESGLKFFRAIRTSGLYDLNVLRTIDLTFTQSNWQSLLAANYNTGSNLTAALTFNGASYPGVGVRYKGNTSYSMAGQKKSLDIEIDYTTPDLTLMGYKTLNLNNANADESIMREPLYFTLMQSYTVAPKANFVRLNINGVYWGLYSSAQQENGDLLDEWFPSNDGDRWKAPSGMGAGAAAATTARFPGGGGGFARGDRALMYLGTNQATYQALYELKTDNFTNPWPRLIHAAYVLSTASAAELRDKAEEVLAVDRWLWFLAMENVFADDDSYYNKGADYGLYYEPESGRIHPIEHDGNESFTSADVRLTPVEGQGNANRPVLNRFLGNAELRQRYLAHMRTILAETFNPAVMNPLIDKYRGLTAASVAADTKKSYTMAAYTNDIAALKSFIQQRYAFLTNHAELTPLQPIIGAVTGPSADAKPTDTPVITAQVSPNGTNGISSVWLYYRDKSYGRFSRAQMIDDGAHGDGQSGDGVFGASVTNYAAGAKVRYYVEARSANAAQAAVFSPARAEQETYTYRVAATPAASTPVVINEWMASNTATLADPQGDFDDWIELRNLTGQAVDLTGRYLTDNPNSPRKWAFPAGAVIPANGYLIVWADENGTDTPGLHASFKLSASGEEILLIDTDANQNQILDSVTFGEQTTDRSYGRSAGDATVFTAMNPTPGAAN